MLKPWLRGQVYWFRKGVPDELRPILNKSEEKFSLRTRDPNEAKLRFLKASAEIEERWARLRQGAVSLTHKESVAIAGQIYREMIAERENDPEGQVGQYLYDGFALGKGGVKVVPITKNQALVDKTLTKMRERREQYNQKRIDDFLLREGYRLQPDSLLRLRKHVDEAIFHARNKLDKMATGLDYSPDPEAAKYPEYVSPIKRDAKGEDTTTPLLSAAIDAWVAEKSRQTGKRGRAAWTKGSAKANELAARRFLELVGDRPLSSYRKKDAKAYKDALLVLPRTDFIKKQFVGKSFSQIVAASRDAIRTSREHNTRLAFTCIDERNINKNIGFVQAFWNWSLRNYDDVPPSLFDGMKVRGQTDALDQKDPFTAGELQSILDAPLFTGCKSPEAWLTPGKHVPFDQGIYWVPLIGLFTGARSGEIIQLDVDDLTEERGILHFNITNERKGQSLKSKASARKIPVHSMLVRLGIKEFVETQRKKGSRMFPDFPRASDGYYSTAYAPRFGRFLERIGVKTEKNSFHSFRHTFEDEALDSNVGLNVVNSLQGHSNPGMAGRYGSGKVRLRTLHEEYSKLGFDELDFSRVLVARGR